MTAFRMSWNQRYVAYAWAHGNIPLIQQQADMMNWPGGLMCGYILWIQERKAEFRKSSPAAFIGPELHDHAAFDAWLFGTVPWPIDREAGRLLVEDEG